LAGGSGDACLGRWSFAEGKIEVVRCRTFAAQGIEAKKLSHGSDLATKVRAAPLPFFCSGRHPRRAQPCQVFFIFGAVRQIQLIEITWIGHGLFLPSRKKTCGESPCR